MAFEKVDKSLVGGRAGQEISPEFRMGYHLATAKTKNKTLYFAFTTTLVEMLGWPVKLSDSVDSRSSLTFTVHEGTKEDAGFLLITYDPRGYTAGTNRGVKARNHTLATSITATRLQYYAVNDAVVEHPTERCEYVIQDDGSLLVQVPDWLRYNGPPADPKPEPVVEPVKEVAKERQPRPTPLRKIAREVVDETAKDLPDIPLNRAARRRLSAEVARKIAH